jgi:probable HAF family extracellular repeat protein
MTELPIPPEARGAVAMDINSSGVVVGRLSQPGGQFACRWDVNGLTLLPSLGGIISTAQAINDAGDIVGQSYVVDFTPGHGFLYRGGVIHDLGSGEGEGSNAFDINNRGEIVGYVDYPDPNGSHTAVRHVMYYTNGRMIDIGTLGGPSGSAIAINDSGVATGDCYSRPTGRIRSFVWKDGLMLDLNAMVIPGKDPAFPFSHAIGINNRGEILCSDSNDAYLLQPIEGESRLTNFSIRGRTAPGEQALIAGFIVAGTTPKSMLLRAAGPSLATYGVNAAAVDPSLVLFGPNGEIGRNDDWQNLSELVSTIHAVGAFEFSPGSRDAAMRTQVLPGAFTVHLASTSSSSIALAEVYAADSNSTLKNFSGRVMAGVGEETAVAGFVVEGPAPKTLLIRAVGPSLTKYGVSGVLADPRVTVFSGETIVESNDDWSSTPLLPSIETATAKVGAFPLQPGSKDAAILVTLPPGAHTVHATGPGTTTGVVLLEIYDVL